MNDPAIWIAVVAGLLSCYFAACTIALRTFSKPRLAEWFEHAGKSEQLERFLSRSDAIALMTSTFRTALNMVLLLSVVSYVDRHQAHWAMASKYLVSFLIAGGVVSVLGIAIPVSVARYHPERLLSLSRNVLLTLLVIFQPVGSFLHIFDPIVRRLSGGTHESMKDNDLSEEILSVVEEHEEEHGVREEQKDMLEAVIELPSTTAGQIMTPRTDVFGIEVNSTLDDIKGRVIPEGHSRVPVYEEDLDHIVGILYVKDLLKFVGNDTPFELKPILRDPFMVPQSKPIPELLAEFKTRKIHMAIVLDEYGGTAGLVTFEDILEEIVGEIEDEYEPQDEKPTIRRISDEVIEVDARVYIDDLNDEMDLELPEDADYDTVGGFVFSTLGHIPREGESFEYEHLKFTVVDVERTRVNRVRIELMEKAGARENGRNGK